jgi:hypothetical protein
MPLVPTNNEGSVIPPVPTETDTSTILPAPTYEEANMTPSAPTRNESGTILPSPFKNNSRMISPSITEAAIVPYKPVNPRQMGTTKPVLPATPSNERSGFNNNTDNTKYLSCFLAWLGQKPDVRGSPLAAVMIHVSTKQVHVSNQWKSSYTQHLPAIM